MAEAAVSFVIERFGDLLIHKVTFLKGVREGVKELQEELVRMRCFLKDADDKQAKDSRIHNWVSEIRDVAYDAENVTEIFIVKIENLKKKGFLRKLASFPMQILLLNNVGKEIESIQIRLSKIANSRETYGIENLGEGSSTQAEKLQRLRLSSPFVEDKDVVGLKAQVNNIVSQLLKADKKHDVVSIVGMGGVGKTTLGKIVYNHPNVKARFDCRVWICISQNFNYKDILDGVMKQVKEPTSELLKILEKMQEQDLEKELYKELEKKCYLIVLDDVWDKEIWECCLVRAIPSGGNGSRLLLTTRNRDVPLHMDPLSIPCELKPLDEGDSWQLLLRKVFCDTNSPKCPSELEDTGREIATRCAGLPLAITVIGGLLARKKKSKSEWERVLRNISELLSASENYVLDILALSYSDLPSHLKSCFLYFGLFPEDREISARKLIHLWASEGFIRQKGTESLESVGENHLEELISRNMVQVARFTLDERIKSCRVHDVLRDLALSKAKDENFLEIYGHGARDNERSARSRHLAIYSEYNFSTEARSHVRSLLFFDVGPYKSDFGLELKKFRLLRVVDLEDIRIRMLPKDVGELCLLTHLSVRNTAITKIPRSLRFLQSLQTLDLRSIDEVEVPNVIWKLENLQHLFLYKIKCNGPFKVEGLEKLTSLSRIQCDHLAHNNLMRLTSLSKLGVWVEENSELNKLLISLVEVKELHSLKLYATKYGNLARLSDLHGLTELKICGELQMLPQPNHFPSNLSRLILECADLEEDPMPILENLSMLSYLSLKMAYFGVKLMISENGFPQLKFLDLTALVHLVEIIIVRGAMQKLKSLRIRSCESLETLPEELKCMTGLEKLEIMDMPTEFTTRLRGVDSYKVCHVRSVTNVVDHEERWRSTKWRQELRKWLTMRIRTHAQVITAAVLFRERQRQALGNVEDAEMAEQGEQQMSGSEDSASS